MVKVLVAGIGGLGGPISAGMIDAGFDCVLVTGNPEICNAIQKNGITVTEKGQTKHVNAPKVYSSILEVPNDQIFDFCFLLTKSQNVSDLIPHILPLLDKKGSIVTFQNGLIEELLHGLIGMERVIPCTVAWGGSMIAAGVYEKTSDGYFFIGEFDGSLSKRLGSLKTLLEPTAPVKITPNIVGVKWSKLPINATINSVGVLTGKPLGKILKIKLARRLFLKIYSEVVDVAHAYGVKLEKIVANPYLFYLPNNSGKIKRWLKDRLVVVVGKRYANVKSSSLQSVLRGRKTEVDYLNGIVVQKAEEKGIDVPANRAIIEMVHEIELGNRPLKDDNVFELASTLSLHQF